VQGKRQSRHSGLWCLETPLKPASLRSFPSDGTHHWRARGGYRHLLCARNVHRARSVGASWPQHFMTDGQGRRKWSLACSWTNDGYRSFLIQNRPVRLRPRSCPQRAQCRTSSWLSRYPISGRSTNQRSRRAFAPKADLSRRRSPMTCLGHLYVIAPSSPATDPYLQVSEDRIEQHPQDGQCE
jgi:hypothetical protein